MLAPPSVVWAPRGPALAEGSIEGTGAVARPRPATATAATPAGTTRSRRLAQGARERAAQEVRDHTFTLKWLRE